jgi:hypothetical protein
VNIVCVAVGKQYELEAQRLLKEYPQTILITEETEGIEKSFEMPLINGLATKCMFGVLLPNDLDGPIIFCDADLQPNTSNPLQYFHVQEDTEIGYVVYQGKWNFPKRLENYQKAIEKVGKINSGFLYFKNINICKEICKLWHEEYTTRMRRYFNNPEDPLLTGEYDEPSLIAVMNKNNFKFEFLDPRWNVWNTSGVPKENAYFIQDHIGDYTMYQSTPTFRNEA